MGVLPLKREQSLLGVTSRSPPPFCVDWLVLPLLYISIQTFHLFYASGPISLVGFSLLVLYPAKNICYLLYVPLLMQITSQRTLPVPDKQIQDLRELLGIFPPYTSPRIYFDQCFLFSIRMKTLNLPSVFHWRWQHFKKYGDLKITYRSEKYACDTRSRRNDLKRGFVTGSRIRSGFCVSL